MIVESVVVILTNLLAGVFGFVVGQLVQWRRSKRLGGGFLVPTVEGSTPARVRLAGIALSLLAVLTAVQAAYTSYQQAKYAEAVQEQQAQEIACYTYLVDELQTRAGFWREDRESMKLFLSELSAAFDLPTSEGRLRAIRESADSYAERQDEYDARRWEEPPRLPPC